MVPHTALILAPGVEHFLRFPRHVKSTKTTNIFDMLQRGRKKGFFCVGKEHSSILRAACQPFQLLSAPVGEPHLVPRATAACTSVAALVQVQVRSWEAALEAVPRVLVAKEVGN